MLSTGDFVFAEALPGDAARLVKQDPAPAYWRKRRRLARNGRFAMNISLSRAKLYIVPSRTRFINSAEALLRLNKAVSIATIRDDVHHKVVDSGGRRVEAC